MPGRQGDVQECPITDIMPYNQSLPRREEDVHATKRSHAVFSFKYYFRSRKVFHSCNQRERIFQIEIDPKAGAYRVTRNGREILQEDKRITFENKGLDVVVSLIDRQFLLALNDQTVFCLPIDDADLKTEATSQPFAIGTQGLGVVVENLRIYRDVYYTHPIGWNDRWALEKPVHLGEDEYFVLGDNSSIAEDSRTWPGRVIRGRQLVNRQAFNDLVSCQIKYTWSLAFSGSRSKPNWVYSVGIKLKELFDRKLK